MNHNRVPVWVRHKGHVTGARIDGPHDELRAVAPEGSDRLVEALHLEGDDASRGARLEGLGPFSDDEIMRAVPPSSNVLVGLRPRVFS